MSSLKDEYQCRKDFKKSPSPFSEHSTIDSFFGSSAIKRLIAFLPHSLYFLFLFEDWKKTQQVLNNTGPSILNSVSERK